MTDPGWGATGVRLPLTVTELTRGIRQLLERGFPMVQILGEISNCKRQISGHTYFTLKDETAQIAAVVWRSKANSIGMIPADGMQVVASGRLTVYEARGVYQIDIQSLRPVGVGDLQQRFDDLRRTLAAEGLFDQGRKRPIPLYPERVGIVTSPTGAVLRDVAHVIRRRFPGVELILAPAKVQGEGASREIAKAIGLLNEYGMIDVIILARGGGSLEDLWAFNEEIVARAISGSAIPVVSAVGHETDYTIADFVADLRAPTPSAAAELVVRDRVALLDTLYDYWYTTSVSIRTMLDQRRKQIEHLLKSYSFNRPFDLLRHASQRQDELERGLLAAMQHRVALDRTYLEGVRQRLSALNPQNTLKRGYAIVHRDGELIISSGMPRKDDRLGITFHDGTIDTRVI